MMYVTCLREQKVNSLMLYGLRFLIYFSKAEVITRFKNCYSEEKAPSKSLFFFCLVLKILVVKLFLMKCCHDLHLSTIFILFAHLGMCYICTLRFMWQQCRNAACAHIVTWCYRF